MKLIKITDTRYGESFRTGINGILYDVPVETEVNVEDALADHIRGLGVAFDEPRPGKGASGSEEGSVDVLAPVSLGFGGTSTVEAPAMKPKSLGSGFGTQPGDVTGSPPSDDEEEPATKDAAQQQDVIEAHAVVSDTRVKAERRSDRLASVAEIAGEGESGSPVPSGASASSASATRSDGTSSASARERSKPSFRPHK
jgi:hypothetical protein